MSTMAPEQRRGGQDTHGEQEQEARDEPRAAERPDGLAPEAVGQMTQRDLPHHAGERDQPERVGSGLRAKADVYQIARLVHLYPVPRVEPGEEADEHPPEARGSRGARKRPVGGGPRRIHDVGGRANGGARRRGAIAVGKQAHVLGPPAREDRVDGNQDGEHHDREPEARRPPAARADQVLRPGQQHDRAHPHAGEGQPHGEPAAAREPVGQEERMAGVAQAEAAAGDEDTEGEIEMPGARVIRVARARPLPIMATPSRMSARAPHPSASQPSHGENGVETMKPTAKAPAVSPRSQPNSSRMGGKSSEKAVRALTPMPMVMNAEATTTQP